MNKLTFMFPILLIFLIGCTNTIVTEVRETSTNANEEPVEDVAEDTTVVDTVSQTQQESEEQEEETTESTIITQALSSNCQISKTTIGTYKKHTITLKSTGEDICGISVDGTLVWISKGDTEVVNGLSITVDEVFVSHSYTGDDDSCKIVLSA